MKLVEMMSLAREMKAALDYVPHAGG